MATSGPQRQPSVALDTNVLMDLARREESTVDAIELIRRRLAGTAFLVLPTVIQELTYIARVGDTPKEQGEAMQALRGIRGWGFHPINFIPAGHAITDSVATKIRAAGLLPSQEVNDSLFVAEAALAGCPIIVSSDRHIRDIDQQRLNQLLNEADVSAVVISSPRKILREFEARR
ncbi:MAG: type II toxin-antitoxin system VapC family toxin [Opitutales bacterium]